MEAELAMHCHMLIIAKQLIQARLESLYIFILESLVECNFLSFLCQRTAKGNTQNYGDILLLILLLSQMAVLVLGVWLSVLG